MATDLKTTYQNLPVTEDRDVNNLVKAYIIRQDWRDNSALETCINEI